MAFYQFEKGLLPEERLVSALQIFMADIDKPIYREFWEEAKVNFVRSFREYIDARIGPG